MVIKKCMKWWKYMCLIEKIDKPNRTESVRFLSLIDSVRFCKKIAKIEPNEPMLTPTPRYRLSQGDASILR